MSIRTSFECHNCKISKLFKPDPHSITPDFQRYEVFLAFSVSQYAYLCRLLPPRYLYRKFVPIPSRKFQYGTGTFMVQVVNFLNVIVYRLLHTQRLKHRILRRTIKD